MAKGLDHGGGIDAAVARWGGCRADWLDLSTGINPHPYPVPQITAAAWGQLPDSAALDSLTRAARSFWNVPRGAAVLPVPGCSAAIAQIPGLIADAGTVGISTTTYNEHAAAFRHWGWQVGAYETPANASVLVYPNNPTGHFDPLVPGNQLTVIDESFCDIAPEKSRIALSDKPNHIILKSFGKFWGLAGLRLGFAIGDLDLIATMRDRIGPWAVSGPALEIGTAALTDIDWANQTRRDLAQGAAQLDDIMARIGAKPMGSTPLFRTYEVADAQALHDQLASHHILTRIFPYSDTWIRLGLPPREGWDRLRAAL